MRPHIYLSPDEGGSTPQTPPVPPVVPPPTPVLPAEDELKFTSETLGKRLERERLKAQSDLLKTLGFETVEAYQEYKKNADALAAAKAEEERLKLSEIERYKADIADRDKKVAEAESARQAAVAEAESARVSAHLHRVFASKGITGTDYAMFRLEAELNRLPDGQELDENAFLDGLLKDPRERVALGLGDVKTPPITTTTPPGGPPPKAPAAGQKHASQMTDEEWTAYKREHHLG